MVNRTSPQKPGRPAPDSRRQAVLSAIIEQHLISGEAVGSHVVSDRFASASGWSSATIRNVMAELEELGLLQQPHTSAGRIPTDKGYRYYVDNMLDRTARYLNVEFSGKSLLAIRAEIIELLREEKALYDTVLRNAMLLCERSLQDDEATAEVYLDGASNILTKPEFSGAERIRELFRMFEEKSRLVKILNECISSQPSIGNVRVVIGRENVASSMKGCAVITTSYEVGGDVLGAIGVVGPMRIEYGRMMAVVNYLARFIERALLNEVSLH